MIKIAIACACGKHTNLSLDSPRRKSRHELLLKQEKQNDDGQYADQSASHQHPVLLIVDADHLAQGNGQREQITVVQNDLRPQEAVLRAHEAYQAKGTDDGTRHGHHDIPIDMELRAAINPGGLQQFVGDGQDRLPEQEDAEHADGTGDD